MLDRLELAEMPAAILTATCGRDRGVLVYCADYH
jgi:hypothetical protein